MGKTLYDLTCEELCELMCGKPEEDDETEDEQMSLWSVISTKIKEIASKMIGAKTVEKTLHVAPVISSQMEEAIKLWDEMYKGKAPWIREPSFDNPVRVVCV